MDLSILKSHLPVKTAPTPQQILLLKVAAAFLTLVFILSTLFPIQAPHKSIYNSVVLGKKNTFVKAFLESDYGSYRIGNGSAALETLCAQTQWIEGIIFQCEAPQGGAVNVRNAILNCVRLAIEVGATGLILPTILSRPHPNLPPRSRPLSHFFSTTHFTETLTSSCPKIQIYSSKDDLWDKPSTASPLPLNTLTTFSHSPNSPLLSNASSIHGLFHNFINITRPSPPSILYSAEFPIIISLKPTYLFYPPSLDPPSLSSAFSTLLIPSTQILVLSATILYSLSQKHNLNLNPLLGPQPSKFYTAQLRTGPDAQAAGWPPFPIQSANYLYHSQSLSLPTIYISCDESPSSIEDLYTFADHVRNLSIIINTKEILLGGPNVYVPDDEGLSGIESLKNQGAKGFEKEWNEFRTLEWDQRVAIDLEVLGWGSMFGGVWESMGSWGVGGRRNIFGGEGRRTVGFGVLELEGVGKRGRGVGKRSVQFPNPLLMEFIPRNGGEWRENTGDDSGSDSDSNSLNPHPDSNSGGAGAGAGAGAGGGERFLQRTKREEKREGGKTHVSLPAPRVGEECFDDGLSVIFGPAGEGREVRAGMWG